MSMSSARHPTFDCVLRNEVVKNVCDTPEERDCLHGAASRRPTLQTSAARRLRTRVRVSR
jgi:hypothetical protein